MNNNALLLRTLFLPLLITAVTSLPLLADSASTFYAASWNVENLFDIEDDPSNTFDDEFLPEQNETLWTKERLENKLSNLAKVIQSMNGGKGPDILGFQEVEHESLLSELANRIEGKAYGIVHAESPDRRGIDTGIIYNKDLFTLLSEKNINVPLEEGQTTRDIAYAELETSKGKKLHIFVNHWPSRSSGSASIPRRAKAASVLSGEVNNLLQADPAAEIIIMGDFNDQPSDPSVRKVLKALPYKAASRHKAKNLYNLSYGFGKKKIGTHFRIWDGDRHWSMYDQIIVSGALLQNAGIQHQAHSFEIVKPEFMIQKKGISQGAPLRTYGRRSFYLGGYSDHFPVGALFNLP